jgi:hypothetical protein
LTIRGTGGNFWDRIRIDGTINARSASQTGGSVDIEADADVVMAGVIDVRGIDDGVGGTVVISSVQRVVLRGLGIDVRGVDGTTGTAGGAIRIHSAGVVKVGAGVKLHADGGTSSSGAGGDGGLITFERTALGHLQSVSFAGTATASGGAGTVGGAGGTVYVGEDFFPRSTSTLDGSSVAEIAGTIEIDGADGLVDFHMGTLTIDAGAQVIAAEGLLTMRSATVLTQDATAIVDDSDGNADGAADPTGSDIDVTN